MNFNGGECRMSVSKLYREFKIIFSKFLFSKVVLIMNITFEN